MRNNCMFRIPHELSGCGEFCVLLKNNCNGYGKDCIAYKSHTKESRAALAEAIAKRKAKCRIRSGIEIFESGLRLHIEEPSEMKELLERTIEEGENQ